MDVAKVWQESPESLMVISPYEDRIVYANRKMLDLVGVAMDGLMAQRASRLFSTCLPQLIAFTQSVEAQKEGITDELSLQAAVGEVGLEVTATRVPNQKPLQLIFSVRDKNRFQNWRVKASAQQNQSFGLMPFSRIHEVFQQIENENQLILSAAGEGIYGVDVDGNTTFLNPAAERMLGYHAEELIGKNAHAAIHHSHMDGSDFDVRQCPIYAAFKDGAVHKVDNEVFWNKLGQPLPVEYTSTPILDKGHLVGAVVVFRDISERLKGEQRLRQALNEVEQLKHRLELENAYLQEEIRAEYNAYQIVGRSLAVQQLIHQIELVAPTGASVLISGESGTGKELIARAIHTSSGRNGRPLVRVNCAAIPAELFESEFFGHVRGAFSGAIQDRLGRFQLADGGTLFLDEVGEIPLSLQGKLLRVLQDSEFERVGDSKTSKVDVRVIAATNRNLLDCVRLGQFREDLYFRLNVFPIHSKALRERREDIPLLVTHFLSKACQRFNKSPLSISKGQMQNLQAYNWPGNIRELENFLERQVILSRGKKLEFEPLPMVELQQPTDQSAILKSKQRSPLTEQDCLDMRYQAVVDALQQCGGKLYGKDGAANQLGLKPTTLASRLKKMGIQRVQFSRG